MQQNLRNLLRAALDFALLGKTLYYVRLPTIRTDWLIANFFLFTTPLAKKKITRVY